MTRGIGGHHTPNEGATNEWLTPPDILRALGPFDLDPCSPVVRPWSTATMHYTIEHDGLSKVWWGRVWLNPPYGPHVGKWLTRLAEHGNGIALIFARTETDAFFTAWDKADAMLFLRGRLHFHHLDGTRAAHNGGAPSVLIAFGENNVAALRGCGLRGALVNRAWVLA